MGLLEYRIGNSEYSYDWKDQVGYRAIILLAGILALRVIGPAESVADADTSHLGQHVSVQTSAAYCSALPMLIPNGLTKDGSKEVYKVDPRAGCLTGMTAVGTSQGRPVAYIPPGLEVVISCIDKPGERTTSGLVAPVNDENVPGFTGEVKVSPDTLQNVDSFATGCNVA